MDALSQFIAQANSLTLLLIVLVLALLVIGWVFLPFALFASNAKLKRINHRANVLDDRLKALGGDVLDRQEDGVQMLEKIHQQLVLQNKLLAEQRGQQSTSRPQPVAARSGR